ncbi:MAG: hypothetical protein CVU81_00470 [Euryarchaeota archaeon HGW-Euryarchaeota-1]|nr:MAG: hypothetical protein CVU81_00470 [Euryarchaeota archaeon HGW-Euryarchaeota-1]
MKYDVDLNLREKHLNKISENKGDAYLRENKISKIEGRENLREKYIKKTAEALKQFVSKEVMIIQALVSARDLEKQMNEQIMHLIEWMSFFVPELKDQTEDNFKFVEISRKLCSGEIKVEEITKETVGGTVDEKDKQSILALSKLILTGKQTQDYLVSYSYDELKKIMPHSVALVGEDVVGMLLLKAGSFKKLAKLPASTIQLLGSEKAFFRFLKTKRRSPKYGVIYNAVQVSEAQQKSKGKVARSLANKLAIAIRRDYFGEYSRAKK